MGITDTHQFSFYRAFWFVICCPDPELQTIPLGPQLDVYELCMGIMITKGDINQSLYIAILS